MLQPELSRPCFFFLAAVLFSLVHNYRERPPFFSLARPLFVGSFPTAKSLEQGSCIRYRDELTVLRFPDEIRSVERNTIAWCHVD